MDALPTKREVLIVSPLLFLIVVLVAYSVASFPLFGVFFLVLGLLAALLGVRAIARNLSKAKDGQSETPKQILFVLPYEPFLALAWLLVPVALASGLGERAAKHKDVFVVAHVKPTKVVLRAYGDTMVLAPYDEKAGTVYTKFQLMNMGSNPDLTFSVQNIGPLRPASVKPARALKALQSSRL